MPRTTSQKKTSLQNENDDVTETDQSYSSPKKRGTKRSGTVISPDVNSQKQVKVDKSELENEESPKKCQRKRRACEVEDSPFKSDENSNHKDNSYDDCSLSPHNGNSSNHVKCTSKRQKIEHVKQDASDPLFCRKLLHSSEDIDELRQFSVLSYNILADCHAMINPSKNYPWLNEEQCKMSFRHDRILAEILHYNADIICLQEISPDYFKKLLPILNVHGYDGHFHRRFGIHYNEGEATFYKKTRFELKSYNGFGLYDLITSDLHSSGLDDEKIDSIKKYLSDSSIFLVSKFTCRNTGIDLNVANTHISWAKPKKPDVQCIEVAMVLRKLIELTDGPRTAHMVCGDFNAPKESCVYQFTRDGYLNDDSIAHLQKLNNLILCNNQKQALINTWWNVFYHTSDNLFSTYQELMQNSSFVTQKSSQEGLVGVDYIWASRNTIGVTSVVETPDPCLISEGIPNLIFPSDHISVKSNLFFK